MLKDPYNIVVCEKEIYGSLNKQHYIERLQLGQNLAKYKGSFYSLLFPKI